MATAIGSTVYRITGSTFALTLFARFGRNSTSRLSVTAVDLPLSAPQCQLKSNTQLNGSEAVIPNRCFIRCSITKRRMDTFFVVIIHIRFNRTSTLTESIINICPYLFFLNRTNQSLKISIVIRRVIPAVLPSNSCLAKVLNKLLRARLRTIITSNS